MEKEKFNLEKLAGPLWGKFWIVPGIEVYHRNDVDPGGHVREKSCPLTVDKVDRQSIKNGEEKVGFRIRGVICHWFKDGQYSKGVFFTKELLPKDIVDKGLILDWLKR